MQGWWDYLLQLDFIPVSPRVWQRTVERHAVAVWPFHALLWAVLAGTLTLAYRRRSVVSTRTALVALAVGWAHLGVVFFGQYVAELTWSASWAMAGCLGQAALLVAGSVLCRPIDDAVRSGAALLAIATAIAALLMPLGRLLGTGSPSAATALAGDPALLAVVTLIALPLLPGAVRWLSLPASVALLALAIVPRLAR